MLDFRRWLRSAAVCTAWMAAAPWLAAHAATDTWKMRVTPDAGSVLEWVRDSGDASGKPFAVVDKRAARIYVFDAAGRLAGESPVLLGSAPGDHTVPGVGERAQTGHVPPEERTTPAGRFEASPGRNDKGEHVVWVDYESAFAIHRLRPGFSFKARADRLGTEGTEDKRVSWGCVVVPVAFYQEVVERVLGKSHSVVYVLPEARPLRNVFHALESN
jgi:hypothetical protein